MLRRFIRFPSSLFRSIRYFNNIRSNFQPQLAQQLPATPRQKGTDLTDYATLRKYQLGKSALTRSTNAGAACASPAVTAAFDHSDSDAESQSDNSDDGTPVDLALPRAAAATVTATVTATAPAISVGPITTLVAANRDNCLRRILHSTFDRYNAAVPLCMEHFIFPYFFHKLLFLITFIFEPLEGGTSKIHSLKLWLWLACVAASATHGCLTHRLRICHHALPRKCRLRSRGGSKLL